MRTVDGASLVPEFHSGKVAAKVLLYVHAFPGAPYPYSVLRTSNHT